MPEIGTIIDDAMRAIERENTTLKNVLPKNYASPDLDKRVLGDVVDLFTNMDMGNTEESKDLLGRTYEYCIAQFAAYGDIKQIQRRKRGEFMLKFICYPKCTTCQKAKKWLDDNNIEYELRDIKEDNPSFDELSEWYKMSGLPLKKFFNTSGLLYKSLGLKDKLSAMPEEEQLKLLATDGMLVKRPLLIGKDFVLVGFREKEWNEKL